MSNDRIASFFLPQKEIGMSTSHLVRLDEDYNELLDQQTMPVIMIEIGENLRTKVNTMVSGDQCSCLRDDDTVSTEDSYVSCASLERDKSSTSSPTRSLENPSASLSRRYSVQSQSPGWGLMVLLLLLLGRVHELNGSCSASPVASRRNKRDASHFIRRGHSHNDYFQDQPLDSAIEHGLKSIEVDVFPRNDELLVAHTVFELDSEKRIDNLYLEPILAMLKRSGSATSEPGATETQNHRPFPLPRQRRSSPAMDSDSIEFLVPPESDSLTLLIDFKGDAEKSVSLLHQVLAPLQPYLSSVDKNGEFRRGKVTVLISGNRPKEDQLTLSSGERFLFIDGRQHDIRTRTDTTLVPLVSIPWRSLHLSRALGRGEQHMRHLADEAHAQGKLLRIWGAPNREGLWRQMMNSNVDLLSIDDHARFSLFASANVFL
jgi:hypothetical protein